jgi:hypothetical protein
MPAALPSPHSKTDSAVPASAGAGLRRRRKRKGGEDGWPSSLQLLEEAFHLLRTTPAATLWLYFAGTVPFALAAFYFWADMSRSSHARADSALGAMGVAAAYFWMKGWQGLFCRRLWEQIHPSGAPAGLSRARMLRYFAAQLFVHALALPVRVVSLIFIGWTNAFFQCATVLAFSQDHGRQPLRRTIAGAARCAHHHWDQNYAILCLLGLFGLFIWVNVASTMVLIPMAIRMFTGVDTVFTLNPMSTLANTTFLFASLLVVWLIVDPMLKAIYTLRCFRTVSRSTGADLISRLARHQSRPGLTATALVAVMLCLAPNAPAQEQSAPATPEELRASIEKTLRQKEYQWRFPRLEESKTDAEKNWLARALTDFADAIERGERRVGEAVNSFFRRLFDQETRKKKDVDLFPGLGISGTAIGLVGKVLLIVAVAALILWVGILIYRRSLSEKTAAADDGGAGGPIDLESESILATQLPEDEWMRLAREQIARGEHRLAIRALFLASLAHLGDRGLLNVARFKSNRDYSRELHLKARSQPELRAAFGENVGLFERVWYGLHEAGREAIDHFTANYERIARPGDSAP